jgi:signal transduction histidine kinase
MGKRATDPTGRRLRNFVLLVIFAVAVPSLLLTGFGLIAINNEREVARKRLYETYKPVMGKVVDRFKASLANLVERSDGILDELAVFGKRGVSRPGEALSSFVANEKLAANFFVIGLDGKVLLPRQQEPLPSWQGYLPEAYTRGEELEFQKRDFEGAVKEYQSALSSLGPGDLERCVVQNALARARVKEGCPEGALEALEIIAKECGEFIDSGGYNLAIGAQLQMLRLLADHQPEKLDRAANRFSAWLADPSLSASGAQVVFASRQALEMISENKTIALMPALGRFHTLARRENLLATVPALAKSIGGKAELRSIKMDGVRRLFVVKKTDVVTGFELVPQAQNPQIDEILREMDFGELLATVHFSEDPCCEMLELGVVASSAFLRATDLTWRLDFVLTDSAALEELTKSRTTMYVWVLLILVVALLVGIGKTVQVMIRETRLSRLKTDFVSSVSHELRTPLTSIRMFTETLLLGRVKSPEEERECLETIGQETERLSRLVERILDFSRMEAGRKAYRFRPESIRELVDAAVAACRPMIEKDGFEVETRIPDDLPETSVDHDAMVEVLINLLSNAIKYSPDGRRVDISAARDTEYVDLAVTDRGVGIPRADHKRIFEKFYRVDNRLCTEVSGSGLGLSLVQYIVKAHGGEIKVSSAPGRGSTFTVRLPIHAGQTAEKTP